MFANESWFFLCRVLSFIFYWFGMVRRKLTIPERWQAVDMHNGGFSHRRVADHFRVNHSIIVRLMQHFRQTGNVTRTGRPRKTTPREDWCCILIFPPTHFSGGKNEKILVFPPERSVYTHFPPRKYQYVLIFPPWFLGGKSEFILKFPPHTQLSPFALIDYTTK